MFSSISNLAGSAFYKGAQFVLGLEKDEEPRPGIIEPAPSPTTPSTPQSGQPTPTHRPTPLTLTPIEEEPGITAITSSISETKDHKPKSTKKAAKMLSTKIFVAFDLDNDLFDNLDAPNEIAGFSMQRWQAFFDAINALGAHAKKEVVVAALTNNQDELKSHRFNQLFLGMDHAKNVSAFEPIRDARLSGHTILLPRGTSKTDSVIFISQNQNYTDYVRPKNYFILSTEGLAKKETLSPKFTYLLRSKDTISDFNPYSRFAGLENNTIQWMLSSLEKIRTNLGLTKDLRTLIGQNVQETICTRDTFQHLVKTNTKFNDRMFMIESAYSDLFTNHFLRLKREQHELELNGQFNSHHLNRKFKALATFLNQCEASLKRLRPLLTNSQISETDKLARLKAEFGSCNLVLNQAARNGLNATRDLRNPLTNAINHLIGLILFVATGVAPGLIYFIKHGHFWKPGTGDSFKALDATYKQMTRFADKPLLCEQSLDSDYPLTGSALLTP